MPSDIVRRLYGAGRIALRVQMTLCLGSVLVRFGHLIRLPISVADATVVGMAGDPVLYFNDVADRYDEAAPFFASFARETATALGIGRFAEVLDVGAGRGALAKEALTHGCTEVIAVDAAPRMMQLLARERTRIGTAVMDAQRLAFRDLAFDAVVSAFVIHIVPDPQQVMREMVRVVRSSGLVAVVVPGRADDLPDPWDDPIRPIVNDFRRHFADGHGRHAGGNYADEEALLLEAGLRDVQGVTVEVRLPVSNGEHYWQWLTSHGAGAFTQGLPGTARSEFRRRVTAAVDERPGFCIRRSAAVWCGRRHGR
ncbi:class I SAM-dependent methyltransferase [Flexivirga caeni]|uniref:class I SAM-dependent methyltransferase n=1 Tax=Flexivirga caeni TaxID=2294115 RepID=UPI0013151FFE|nr:methyltransferase domain-containing protein [Flexivirga caeni]